MLNLLFVGHDFKFIDKFIDYCNSKIEYNVKLDKWKSHNIHDEKYSKKCIDWADVIFCEWGLGNVKWYSNNKKKHQKLIIRIHSQERRTDYYKYFNINNIDKVICVSPYMVEEISKLMKINKEKIVSIYNYVDCKYFDKNKINEANYNIALVGICPKSKRLDIALDIFNKIVEKDSRYKLYIKGKLPNEYPWLIRIEDEKSYYDKVFNKIKNSKYKDNIVFEKFDKNLDIFFTKIGYILSTSDFESFHLTVAEGMSSGSIPIILNWDGCEQIYPNQYICKNLDDAVNLITTSNYKLVGEYLKLYTRGKFDISKIFKQIENLIIQ